MNKFMSWQEIDFSKIGSSIIEDSVILAESDTVLGLFTLVSQIGFDSLNKIKGRQSKPYLIVIPSRYFLENFSDCNFSDSVERLIGYCWPGPLTLIVKAKDSVPSYIKSAEGSVAIRMPKHAELLKLLEVTGPLFSTSANLAGKPIPNTLADVDSSIVNMSNIVIANKDHVGYSTVPSTILDCTSEHIKLVREGAYDVETLENVIGAKIIR